MTPTPSPETPVSDDETVTRLLSLHEKMLTAVKRSKPYPVSIRMGQSDLDTVLSAAVELERRAKSTPSADVSSLIERAINLLVSVADPHDVNTPDALVAAANARAAIASYDTEAAMRLEALDWFGGDPRMSLEHHSPVYCDDADQSEEWRVYQALGSINDREWDIVGRGETPAAALIAAKTNRAPLSKQELE